MFVVASIAASSPPSSDPLDEPPLEDPLDEPPLLDELPLDEPLDPPLLGDEPLEEPLEEPPLLDDPLPPDDPPSPEEALEDPDEEPPLLLDEPEEALAPLLDVPLDEPVPPPEAPPEELLDEPLLEPPPSEPSAGPPLDEPPHPATAIAAKPSNQPHRRMCLCLRFRLRSSAGCAEGVYSGKPEDRRSGPARATPGETPSGASIGVPFRRPRASWYRGVPWESGNGFEQEFLLDRRAAGESLRRGAADGSGHLPRPAAGGARLPRGARVRGGDRVLEVSAARER